MLAQKDKTKTVKSLIKEHANLDLQDEIGQTALMYASIYTDDIQIVKDLVKADSDILIKNKDYKML